MTEFEWLILISIVFLRFYFTVFFLVLVLIELIYQARKNVFNHISNTSKFAINTPLRVVPFMSVYGMWWSNMVFRVELYLLVNRHQLLRMLKTPQNKLPLRYAADERNDRITSYNTFKLEYNRLFLGVRTEDFTSMLLHFYWMGYFRA